MTDNDLSTTGEPLVNQTLTKERTIEDSKENNSTLQQSIVHNAGISVGVGGNFINSNNTLSSSSSSHKPTVSFQNYIPEALRDMCLIDEEFCKYTLGSKQITKDELRNWLDAFNKWLRYTGETAKSQMEYRKHFRNWLSFRNITTENPLKYNPANDTKHGKYKRELPNGPVYTPAHEALRQQKEQIAACMKRVEEEKAKQAAANKP
ncbi:hypothetical protein CAP35_13650 [Chitinophagaceae bacterium IBVUCB1]|nr:hypothetical protein CAP35_13650 [Chitinophagaceae bacterium IBVUCB1]